MLIIFRENGRDFIATYTAHATSKSSNYTSGSMINPSTAYR